MKSAFLYVWEYVVPARNQRRFEQLYGASGDWVRLFQRAPGYIRTELHRDRAEPRRFMTFDYWESRTAWEAFRSEFAQEYEVIDAKGAQLATHEREVGRFEAVG